MPQTKPVADESEFERKAAHLVIEPGYRADDGSEWVHQDYQKATDAYSHEQHIKPIDAHEKFGDVDSWADYVTRYTGARDGVLLTWNESGLKAVLDYHSDAQTPNRAQWWAEHRFTFSPQWLAWSALANGQPRPQKQLVESLEDLAEDIVSPDQAALLSILRTLRTTAAASGETVINPDGTTSVSWTKESTIKGKAEIPAFIGIKIPVLKGHYAMNEEGQQAQRVYEVDIRVRPSVDEGAHVLFRLSMPWAERLLEKVYAERVQTAKDALGDGYTLLRDG